MIRFSPWNNHTIMYQTIHSTLVTLILVFPWFNVYSVVYADGWSSWGQCHLQHSNEANRCGQGTRWRHMYNCYHEHRCYEHQPCQIPCSGEAYSSRVDGGWSAWSSFSTCSTSCGTGTKYRSRTCTNPQPQHGGQECHGSSKITQHCRSSHCPIDGGWSDWSSFSECSATCGGGITTRLRSCTHPVPAHGGRSCSGDSHSTEHCNLHSCPINGGWSHWSHFHRCSASCGGGTKLRVRSCNHPKPANGGQNCIGDSQESELCNDHNCPVDGNWGHWSAFSHCSVPCGGGAMVRHRSCNNPKPSDGGHRCRGYYRETAHCNQQDCPVNGGWSHWSDFSICSVSCGGGTKTRSRSCTDPTPTDRQHYCHGDPVQSVHCNYLECPVDGGWSPWSHFSPCTVSCGEGTMSRERFCNNPRPAHNGSSCVGNNKETSHCHDRDCPINGGWSHWSTFSHCSVTCGGGNSIRSRTCTNPSPAHGGHSCHGDPIQTTTCRNTPCPVDGGWGGWSQWSAQCSVTCGQGVRTRDRHCVNPPPAHGGAACVGDAFDSQACQQPDCPVNGQWSGWSGFSLCSTTCGPGAQIRKRTCTQPPPSNGGSSCVGDEIESVQCQINPCPATTTQQWITIPTNHPASFVTLKKK
nr:coadhesin-like isoform X2 [Crassostrea virginica]